MDLPSTFVVAVPDTDAGAAIASRIDPQPDDTVVSHASGRPWLIARIAADPVLIGRAGTTSIVVIGPTSATAADLRDLAETKLGPADLIERCSTHAGSFHVFVSLDGVTVARGTVSQNRRVFHTRLHSEVVLSDRADVLARLGGRPISAQALGMHLLPNLPHPLNDLTMWDGVESVAGAQYALVSADGTSLATRTWWRRPAPTLTRRQGADRLRHALQAAVAARTGTGTATAADLSGGLDSTPVCYFAAQGPSGVLARTFYTDDPGGREDLHWAERALAAMPGIHEHEIFSVDTLPDFYGGLDDLRLHLDDPSQTFMAAPRLLAMIARDVSAGIGFHLTGIGGDHLFRRVGAWDHHLARTKPLTAWGRARADAKASRVPARATLRQLMDRRRYSDWLLNALEQAHRRSDTIELPGISDWGPPLAFPEWVTDAGVEEVVAGMTDLAQDADGLSDSVAEHFDLYTIHEAGRVARGMSFLGQDDHVLLDSPLVDDHVLEAVFAVRYDERDTPMEWKPLMKEAMRGLLPDDYLRRATKIGGGPQAVRGYAQHYDTMVGIWEDSGVLDSGLIDKSALLATSRPSGTRIPSPMVITLTNLALFLRDIKTPATQHAHDRTR